MRIVQWLLTAYAPLSQRWMLVDGNTWASRRASAPAQSAGNHPQPILQGLYP